ncbi:hypothetical protein [Neobacillus drentensis]|jgi:major intracellular serine protease|uniref:hypothetical protein n=2 Tax=Neobacillus TaxID=2675232 RepID=UPI000BFA6C22|nr:hypothetical protein CN481_16265 [Bacillus sp. AFS006103]
MSMKLLQCFCEARRTQAFYTNCLNDAVTNEEKEFLAELVKSATKTSNEIRAFCELIQKKEKESTFIL